MKRISALVISLILLCGLSMNAAAETVEFAVGEWAPFISESMPGNGHDGEVVRAAMKAVGMDVKYNYYKWTRSKGLIKQGEALASFPWSKTPTTTAIAIYSDPISVSRQVFIYNKSKLGEVDFKTPADLKKYNVAGIRSYSHVEILEKAGIKLDMSNDLETALKKLKAGRVDMVPDNDLVLWGMAKQMFGADISNYALTKSALTEADMHVIFSKNHPQAEAMKATFNEGLAKIKASGEYDQIDGKYK